MAATAQLVPPEMTMRSRCGSYAAAWKLRGVKPEKPVVLRSHSVPYLFLSVQTHVLLALQVLPYWVQYLHGTKGVGLSWVIKYTER